MKKVVLIVLDGYGISNNIEGNPINLVNPPNINFLKENYPYITLNASGINVGLPENEVGNSEVGHINIGAGSIVLQDLPRINSSIDDGSFYTNPSLLKTINHANKTKGNIHILGLVGQGNVHSSIKHLYALLEFYKKNNIKNVFLHLFTDGRDSPPNSGIKTVKEIEEKISQMGIGKIVSIMGRYFAMDRDNRWDRTQKAYECLTAGNNNTYSTAIEAIEKSYEKGITDEFIEPTNILNSGKEFHLIKDGDSVVFFNFRIDRAKQLAKSFVPSEYKKGLTDLYFLTMTQYEASLPFDVIFPTIQIRPNVAQEISRNNLNQLRISESEKERFVTYYFNGQSEIKCVNEDRIIIPSPKVDTYDKKPEMSAYEITDSLIENIELDKYQFILVNFANADMVGHTGDIEACKKAIETLDECLGRISKSSLENNYSLLITADHGNIEQKINPQTKQVSTEHTSNPVPFMFIDKDFKNKKINFKNGKLSDVGVTVLSLLGLKIPEEMTGRDLLNKLT
ncbi:MAG: 2,3-bisphosphoglycerate-independent phosphoglycerate mutase [Nanoarchaeota archaeon]